jgi:hypothetical protein
MITYTPLDILMGILQRLGPGTPAAYNPVYDMDGSGLITVADLLICLTLFG